MHGRKVYAVENPSSLTNTQSLDTGKRTVTYEARILKDMLKKVLAL